ncbi:uncharacterized protein LOC144286196 isoform X2 [Canis aureus]
MLNIMLWRPCDNNSSGFRSNVKLWLTEKEYEAGRDCHGEKDMPTPNMKTYRSNSMAMESTSWHLRGNSTGLSLLLHMTGNLHRMKQKGQMSLGSESQGQTSNPRLFGWKCGCLGRDGLVQNLKNLNLEPKSSSSAKC